MSQLPQSVLFVCYLNAIRSPMAEALMKARYGNRVFVDSCGMSAGEVDDLMVAVMREKGHDLGDHASKTLGELDDHSFDLVIAFTPAAAAAAEAEFAGTSAEIETWPVPDPTAGVLDVRAMMNQYRSVRDYIDNRIVRKFGEGD